MSELPFHRERPTAVAATPLSYWDLRHFDDVLDARSPAEYAEDHLPEAINVPTLDDAQRALVGTIYKERSAFEAKRVGAPLAARNIADHVERLFAAKPRNWKPLVYCWRGGGRSGALVHVLRQDCGSCHGLPPTGANHIQDVTLEECTLCHSRSVDALGQILFNGDQSEHIDGNVDFQ